MSVIRANNSGVSESVPGAANIHLVVTSQNVSAPKKCMSKSHPVLNKEEHFITVKF